MKKISLLLIPVILIQFLSAQPVRYLDEIFSSVTVDTNIQYGTNIDFQSNQQPLLMDVYRPAADTLTDRPILIFLHGGGVPLFSSGDKSENCVVEICNRFAKRGFVTAAVNYRVGWDPSSPNVEILTANYLKAMYRAMQDVKTCVRYFRNDANGMNQWGIDPTKIVAGGSSSGGQAVLVAASLSNASDFSGLKYQDGLGNPYINTSTIGDINGFGGSQNFNNYLGISAEFHAVISLGGAIGDTSWIDAGELPVVAFQGVLSNGVSPFNTGIITNLTGSNVFEVIGPGDFMPIVSRKENNSGFSPNNFPLGPPNRNSLGIPTLPIDGLYPFWGEGAEPWNWYASNPSYNPNASQVKAMAYIDTIMDYACPRLHKLFFDFSSVKVTNENHVIGKTVLLKKNIQEIDVDTVKVCADGSSSTKILFHNNNDTITTSNIKFEVTDDNDTISTEQLGVVSVDTIIGDSIFATYFHPTFVNDTFLPSRPAFISIKNDTTELCKINLAIYRAPIVFMHGFIADETTFKVMSDSLVRQNLYPRNNPFSFASTLLHRVDYSRTNMSHFVTNYDEVPDGIDSVMRSALVHKYSCGKVILIGHSMGGILSRLYLQGYFYRHDIQKLITVNTPHYGSQLPNWGLKLFPVVQFIFWNTYLGLLDYSRAQDYSNNLGAVLDLRANSLPIRNINRDISSQEKVPSATLSTVDTTNTLNNSVFVLLGPGITGSDIFFGDQHDLVVPRKSQRCNIFIYPSTIGQAHVGSTNNAEVISFAKNLINSDPLNQIFTQTGFPPDTLPIPQMTLGTDNWSRSGGVDSIKITTPVSGHVYNPGDTVTVDIFYDGSINTIALFAFGKNFVPITIDSTPVSQLKFVIPANALGRINLSLFGGTLTTWTAADTTHIIVASNVIPDSVVCIPAETTVPLGLVQRVGVNGYFSGNASPVNLTGLTNLSIQYDTAALIYKGNNLFQTKAIGTTTIIFDYLGLVDSSVISVYNDSTAISTTFDYSKNEICAGDAVTFYDLSEGLATSYEWSFAGGSPSSSVSANQVVTYSAPGIYPVSLKTTFINGVDSVLFDSLIVVTALPSSPIISITGAFLVTQAGYNYKWFYSSDSIKFTQIPSATGDSINLQNSGYYYVEITNASGCPATSIPQFYLINNIRQIDADNLIDVFPNPATNMLNIQTKGLAITEINIYNAVGILVTQTKQPQNKSIDISQLATGVYVAEVKTKHATLKRRWVKI